MEKANLDKGYIGSSRSSNSINAIIWAGGEDFYFFVVTPWEAALLDNWLEEGKPSRFLSDILPNISLEDEMLFRRGEVIDTTTT